MTMDFIIATHQHVDLDAVTATWLLSRYAWSKHDFTGYRLEFVPAGHSAEHAHAIADTGGVCDREWLAFDHHQFINAERSATDLVYQYLTARHGLTHLQPLIDLVTAGDHGLAQAAESRLLGLHAILSSKRHQLKTQGISNVDTVLCEYMFDILDGLAGWLKTNAEALERAQQCIAYKSDRLIGLVGGDSGTTRAILDSGMVQVVVFLNESENTTAFGVQRSGDTINCGELVRDARRIWLKNQELKQELETWYCHPSGFFAGRGTHKNPDNRPVSQEVFLSVCELFNGLLELKEE